MLKRLLLTVATTSLMAFAVACGGNKCEDAAELVCDCPQEGAAAACQLVKAATTLGAGDAACEGDNLKAAECALDNKDAYCEATFAGTATSAAGNAYQMCVGS